MTGKKSNPIIKILPAGTKSWPGYNGVVLVFCGIVLLIRPVLAADHQLSGYSEFGRRAADEDFEEGSGFDDYSYRKYSMKSRREITPRLRQDFTVYVYDKDYSDREDLDNISRVFKNNWAGYLGENENTDLKFDLNLKYKEKRYGDSPLSEYNQTRVKAGISYIRKKEYKLGFFLGANNYDYCLAAEKDVFSYFTGINFDKYLSGEKFKLISAAKFEQADREKNDRRRAKYDITTGFDYKLSGAWADKISARVTAARRDTKSEEDRDDDLDYDYWKYYLSTTHKISKFFRTGLKYQRFKRDYLASNLDNRGYFFRNVWRYDVVKDSGKNIYFSLTGKHKRVDYSLSPAKDYTVNSCDFKGVYNRKKVLKLTAAIEGDFYDRAKPADEKDEYCIKMGAEKTLIGRRLVLGLDFKYKYTDNKTGNDRRDESVKISFRYSWD